MQVRMYAAHGLDCIDAYPSNGMDIDFDYYLAQLAVKSGRAERRREDVEDFCDFLRFFGRSRVDFPLGIGYFSSCLRCPIANKT